MRRLLFIFFILAGTAVAWYFFFFKKNEPATLSAVVAKPPYSAVVGEGIREILNSYSILSELLVSWDSLKVPEQALDLSSRMEALNWKKRPSDTAALPAAAIAPLERAKKASREVHVQKTLEGKRRAFNTLSNDLYELLRSLQYSDAALYLHECPMAFNDDETAQWLSTGPEIRNPYLGLYHPKYKKGMLACGANKSSMNAGQASNLNGGE